MMHVDLEVTVHRRPLGDWKAHAYEDMATIRVYLIHVQGEWSIYTEELTPFEGLSWSEQEVWAEYGHRYANRLAARHMTSYQERL
jgi:hypothetical protein